MTLEKIIHYALAAVLLLCLLDMPYGYYQLVRFVAAGALFYLGYKEQERGQQESAIVLWCLAFLFQPFFKIPLGRMIWNLVDIAVAVFLIARKKRG